MTLTTEAEEFISEWRNRLPYVTAHTSGSTGKPKEIRLLKSDMRASARATAEFFGLTSASTLWLPLSPSYIAGKMQIVRALEAGCSLVVEPPSNTPLHHSPPGVTEISLLPIVPSQADGLLASPLRRRVKAAIIGGAPLSREAEQRVIDSGLTAFATYGMTETCSHVALRRLGEEEFHALPGFTFSTDSRGCLTIETRTLSFSRLVTNDVVALSSPQSFRWLGRWDNVINSGGLKIHPEEIESLIAPLLPPGALFYVASRPSAKWGEELILVTDTPHPGLTEQLRTLLGPTRAPKAVVVDPDIRLTGSKKIIRRKFFD